VSVTSASFSTEGKVTVFIEHIPATPVITVSDNNLLSSAMAGNQWYNSQGLILGATGQKYFPLTADNYYAIVINAKGCLSNVSNELEFGFAGLKPVIQTGFSVYPNPFSGKFYIDYTINLACQVKIIIYNSAGNEIISMDEGEKTAGNHKAFFDGSRLVPGVYTCKIFSGNGVLVTKVIKN